MTSTRSDVSWQSAWRHMVFAVALATLPGCGSSTIIDPKALDAQIEQEWMVGREKVEAIEFLERGGSYANLGVPDEVNLDQVNVLPLLKQFRDEVSLESFAILEGPEHAMAIVVPMPSDSKKRNRLRDILQVADDSFSGLLLDNWGEKWLSLDFLNEAKVDTLKRAGALEALQKELEFQRRKRD